MPDINIFTDPKPVVGLPPMPAQTNADAGDGLLHLNVKAPMWLSTAEQQVPHKTQLKGTLRYTDPDIGFDPFDQELEFKYADEHWGRTFGNNVLKGFYKLAGTFAQSVSTIPRAITSGGDAKNLYDTEFTNTLQDWYEDLEIALPTYKNENQTEHPIKSWFTGDFFNNLGGAINNLGFTAGAILGAVTETAAITYLTRGLGTPAAVGRNLTRWFGNFGRTIASGRTAATEVGNLARQATVGANEAKLLERGAHQMGGTWKKLPPSNTELTALNTERGLIKAEQGIAKSAKESTDPNWVRYTGAGVPNEFASGANATRNATANTIDKGLNTMYGVTKITDAVRYNLGLLTSAMAEGAFEANQVMRNTEAEARQAFYDKNGYDAKADDMKEINALSQTAADFTMKANIAILYLSNRLNWGSLFKPTTQTVVSGSLRGGFSRFTKKLDDATGQYTLVDKSPNSRFGKYLLYLTSPGKTITRGLVESAEEGAQFITSEGSQDYAKRKYEGTNRGELSDYIKSFNYGVNRTFKSNEGLENLVGGFVGGILGGFMFMGANKLRGVKNMTAKQRLQYQIDGLNQQTFKNIFQHHVDGAAAQQSMAGDYEKAVKAGDIFTAKNIKAEMLHNWVNTAVKTNSFDARLDELEAAKDLKGTEFSKMWDGLEYNEDNRQDAVNYLDSIKQKATAIKKDIDKVDRTFLGNPFNHKKQPLDWAAHETWKETLAKNLGISRDYQNRIKELNADIQRVLPGMSVNEAIKLTSKEGISDILDKMSKAINSLEKQQAQVDLSPELQKIYRDKARELNKLFNEMQQHIFNNFEAKDFVPTLRKMYKLMQGSSMESNKYLDEQKLLGEEGVVYTQPQQEEVNDDEIIDIFGRLVDTNRLHEANYQAVYSYNSLLKPRGAKKYSNYVKDLINKTNAAITFTDDGKVETPVDVERQAEEEARLATAHMPEEEMTKERRDEVRDIIIKQAAGEELTPEEEEILEAYPQYEEKVKTAEVVKAAIIKEKTPKQQAREANQAQQAAAEQRNYVEDESGFRKEVSPVELLNKINSHEKVGKDANKNLFKAIFSKVNNFLNTGLTAKLAQSDYSYNVEKNGNFKQTYTPISLFDARGNKTGTSGIYKSQYLRNIEIYHNGEFIGILKPADSLFLDNQGIRPIHEMNEAEFTDVTGMPRTEYKAYMREINAYKKAYDSLLDEFTTNTAIDNATLIKYFPEIRVNLGNTVFNSSTAKDSDTLIKDLAHRPTGTALISYKNEGGYRKATIVNERELADNNPTYYNKLKAFISTDKFKEQAQRNQGRYMLAVPINGEYTNNSLIYSRPAEINDEAKKELVSILGNNVGKELEADEADLINYNIANTYYIANADRSVKGTTIDLLVNEDGSLSLQIQNNEKGTAYNNTLNIENPQITDYQSIIKTIQNRINDEERLDRNLQKLKITIKDDSIKFQVLNDKDIYSLKDVEAQIKVATIPNIFENYSINMYPKGSTKGESRPTSKAATQKQRETIIEKVKNLKPVAGKVSDIEVSIAQQDPEQFLREIADQAFGVTRDPDDNRVTDVNGSREQSLVERFGKEIVDGAKSMFPLETVQQEQAREKTPEEIEAAKQIAAKRVADAKIDREYFTKKLALHDSFINNLTEAGKKIKDFIAKNPNFVGREAEEVNDEIINKINVQQALIEGAKVTIKDVRDYMISVSIYNQQHAKLTNIAEAKKAGTVVDTTGETVFAKTTAETSIILQDLFGLPKDQADATAEVYERNRQAWVQQEYQTELNIRKQIGEASEKYSAGIGIKAIARLNKDLEDAKQKLELRQQLAEAKIRDLDKIIGDEKTTDKNLQKAIAAKQSEEATLKVLTDDVVILQQKVNNPTTPLYGADLLDYINQQSYSRFGFGKMQPSQLTDQLISQKIIEINCT